jgi:hypothetical protein
MAMKLLFAGRRREIAGLALVLLALVFARIPALTGPPNLSPDATEYIDGARNFAAGDGLVLRIRAYFFAGSHSIPYPLMSLRSPLFPLIMGSCFRVVPSPQVFQWFNLGLFIVNMCVLACILRPLMPGGLAAWALLVVGLTEPLFLTSVFAWAEQTAFFWLLLALLMATREWDLRLGVRGAALQGLVAGMASLSRPEYILVGLLLFARFAFQTRRRLALLAAFFTGFAVLPVVAAVWTHHTFGRAFFPGDYLFRSREYWSYFSSADADSGGASSFIARNALWILGRVLRNFVNYAAKLVGWKNLLALVLLLPAVVLHAVRGGYDQRTRLLPVVATSFFFAYCLVWAGIDRERYLLPVTTFLMPLCMLEAHGWWSGAHADWKKKAGAVLIFMNLPLLVGNVAASGVKVHGRQLMGERFYAADNPAWSNPDITGLANWVESHLGKHEVICAENPFLLNYLTGHSTVLLPEHVRPEGFARFLKDYRVSYWVTNLVYTKRPAGQLQELEAAVKTAGAHEVGAAGTYRVWKLPDSLAPAAGGRLGASKDTIWAGIGPTEAQGSETGAYHGTSLPAITNAVGRPQELRGASVAQAEACYGQ